MSMGELRGLADALRNLDHLAGYKNKLLVKRKAMEFAAVKAELLASPGVRIPGKARATWTRSRRTGRSGRP